jgi:DNA-directed RNA polymerase subunit RPC12/RpoP
MRDDVEVAESAESHLVIETACPECGAPTEADLWDATGRCEFCNSLLVFGGNLDNQLFVIADMRKDASLVSLLVAHESAIYQARLEAQARTEEGLMVHSPAGIEHRVEQFAQKLRSQLEVVHKVDFFVPYRINQKTVIQGILGRRPSGPKESFIQSFHTEDLERLYDPGAYQLRDRGLKIRGFRLTRLGENHLKLASNRFLPIFDPAGVEHGSFDDALPRYDRSHMRIRQETQIITKIAGNWRERHLTVYKHLTYACTLRSGIEEHLIFDRQFGTVAARLGRTEAERYLRVPDRELSQIVAKPEVHAIASECPNCGWELDLPHEDLIAFCPTCRHAIRVDPKGLEIFRYEKAALPDTRPGESILAYPFWSFRFRIRAGGRDDVRIWDWLEAVSPQQTAIKVRETDPAESRFLIPARNLHGNRALDETFARLTGYVNWRQPPTVARRPLPDEPVEMLGVEVSATEAAALGPYALLALHDNSSTRRFNARNFREMIAEAELDLGSPVLVVIPLVLVNDHWQPPMGRSVSRAMLEARPTLSRVRKSFSLV